MSASDPVLLSGGAHADERGRLRFCNDFDLSRVRRFYTVANSAASPRRGWIMHRQETKWFFPIRGVTTVEVEGRGAYALDAAAPAVLEVPPENWFAIIQDGEAEVMVFSDVRLGACPDDDFRKPYLQA